MPWVNASLSCTYEWVGTSGITNTLSFDVSQLYHLDELNPTLQNELGDLQTFANNADPNQTVNVFLNEPDNLGSGTVITGPGGTSSTTNQEIPLCGNGKAVYPYSNNYLITTRLFACDLGQNEEAYITAMQKLADCVMAAIESRYP